MLVVQIPTALNNFKINKFFQQIAQKGSNVQVEKNVPQNPGNSASGSKVPIESQPPSQAVLEDCVRVVDDMHDIAKRLNSIAHIIFLEPIDLEFR